MSVRGAWRVGVLALVVGVGLGGGAGLLLASPPTPGFVASGGEAAWVDVTRRVFDDARTVQASAVLAPQWQAKAPAGGVVRRANCKVGEPIASGAAPFVVDDRPIVFLALTTPPWRDMGPGVRGADVLALQNELRRLGHKAVPTDGAFGASTAAAVKALWKAAGGDPNQTRVPLGQVVWLPERSVVPATCPLRIGQRISSGEPLLTVGGGLESLTARLPADAATGARVAVLGDATAPIGPDGAVSDRDFLAGYAKGRGFLAFLADPSATLTVATRLAEPVPVVAVPPSSLYDLADGHGCVADESGPLKVKVVASQLGETFVAGDRLPTRVQVAPDGGQPCA